MEPVQEWNWYINDIQINDIQKYKYDERIKSLYAFSPREYWYQWGTESTEGYSK